MMKVFISSPHNTQFIGREQELQQLAAFLGLPNREDVRLPLETAIPHVKQVASALQYAHDERLVHRDLKTENLLLGHEQQAWLADFDLAFVVQSTRLQPLQQTAGTPTYMAPEQLQGHPTPASDQYALGVLIYEWLAGERHFSGSLTELAVKQALALPPALSERVPTVPSTVDQVALKALAKDQQRFANAQDFALALKEAYRAEASGRTPFAPFSEYPAKSRQSKPTTRNLPSGTVTLLFTDIEGSTRLLEQLGNRYADVLSECRQLLHTTIQEWNGHEVDTQGDAFLIAFARATDAVSAAVEAQRALATHPWPQGVAVRIHMGLHTGEPTLTQKGYVGLDVHRAARIMSIGHGRQVLLSQTTYHLVEQDLPDEVSLRDLGEYRLKDLGHPKHLFQLVISDLPADFPHLKTLDTYPNNLPVQLTPFIEHELELAEVLLKHLKEVLHQKKILLLLDNFEQIVTAGIQVGDLLATCPNLKVLVTSREVEKQRLFRQLSVSVGSYTLQAVEAGQTLNTLASLVDKSLLQETEQEGEQPRIAMLERTPDYALKRLVLNREMEATQQAHAAYYYYQALVEEPEPQPLGSQRIMWPERPDREHENLRAALHWLLEQSETEQNLKMALLKIASHFGTATEQFWAIHGHKDPEWWIELLGALRCQDYLSIQSPHNIDAGEKWEDAIQREPEPNKAQIILLLISPDFIASDYCYNLEMKPALERHERDEAIVIPILCSYTWEYAPLAQLNILPRNHTPIAEFQEPNEAFGSRSFLNTTHLRPTTPTGQLQLVMLLDCSGSMVEKSTLTDPNGYSTSEPNDSNFYHAWQTIVNSKTSPSWYFLDMGRSCPRQHRAHSSLPSTDVTVQIWNIIDGRKFYLFVNRHHSGITFSIAWSPNSTGITSGNKNRTIQIWNTFNRSTTYTYSIKDDTLQEPIIKETLDPLHQKSTLCGPLVIIITDRETYRQESISTAYAKQILSVERARVLVDLATWYSKNLAEAFSQQFLLDAYRGRIRVYKELNDKKPKQLSKQSDDSQEDFK